MALSPKKTPFLVATKARARGRGISKVVSVTLLMLIAISTGIALYAYMGSKVSSVHEYDIGVKPAVIEAVKVFSFKEFYKLFLYVSVDPPRLQYVYVKDVVTGNVYKTEPDLVEEVGHNLYLVVATIPKTSIKSRTFQVMISSDGGTASSVSKTIDLGKMTVPQLPPVYLLAVTGFRSSWIDPNTLLPLLQPLVGKLISEVIVIDTPSAWENLLNNGPNDAIVINCHGEAVPATASTASYADNPQSWVPLFRKIGERVRKGWIWVSVIGYPFYYITNYTDVYAWDPGSGRYGPGPLGAEVALGVAGGYGLFWGYYGQDLVAKITDAGKSASTLTGIKLPSEVMAYRSMNYGAFLGASLLPFYVNETGGREYYSASALFVGSGAFILIGFSGWESGAAANASVAFSIYAYIEREPTPTVIKHSGKAYVLACLDTPGSWSDTRIEDGKIVDVEGLAAETALSMMGFTVSRIDSVEDVWDVLGAPERWAAVVNTLEEALPIPSELIATPARTQYWEPLTNEGVVTILNAKGVSGSDGLINYTSEFVLEDGNVTLYITPLTSALTASGELALEINFSHTTVRFTSTSVEAYLNGVGTVTLLPLKLLHTYAVTFAFDSSAGTVNVEVKDLDTGDAGSATGSIGNEASSIKLWLGSTPSTAHEEATALVSKLVISVTYRLGASTYTGTLTVDFAVEDASEISSQWRTYFRQEGPNATPDWDFPYWKTLISLLMLRVKQGWTLVMNSNGYTAYYVSNPTLGGTYTIGTQGLDWVFTLLEGDVAINWNTEYPSLTNTDLPGWLTPNWEASRMQLPTGITITGKTYGTESGYLMCYAIKYGAGSILLGGAGTSALPVNLVLLDEVYG